jgi:hypothetical protein
MNDPEITFADPETGDVPVAESGAAPDAQPTGKPGSAKRVVASLLLAVGLLTVGGAAIVNAASPDPSATTAPAASSAPSTTTPATPGTNGTAANHANCPNM